MVTLLQRQTAAAFAVQLITMVSAILGGCRVALALLESCLKRMHEERKLEGGAAAEDQHLLLYTDPELMAERNNSSNNNSSSKGTVSVLVAENSNNSAKKSYAIAPATPPVTAEREATAVEMQPMTMSPSPPVSDP
jgi:hypothetical protein